ncbi:MAG: hypothetical protein JRG96_08950 [Deltaproteobacteria bacterium]|nr:hypothetical protein [Deltaproteobacteria bacterium]MBW2421079.1 hypothetical protein [Deltaproteobacteria bacterium]
MSRTGEGAIELPQDYPPPRHMLRDLGIRIERAGDAICASLDVVPELCGRSGALRAGVLATLADVCAGECAARAGRPSWVATTSLSLQLGRRVGEGVVNARPSVLRRSRSRVVVEVDLQSLDGAQPRPLGLATVAFSLLPARGPIQTVDNWEREAPTSFALPDSGLTAPFAESIGARVLDAARGEVELTISAYNGNSLGAAQGGALATLVDLASESAVNSAAGEEWITTDFTVHFLSLGRQGPLRTSARLLRQDDSGARLRVEIRDAGAGDRLITVATSAAGPLA